MKDEQADQAVAPSKKRGRAKLILVIGAALLMLAGGGAIAFFTLIMPPGSPADAGEALGPELAREEIVFVDLPELLVNLNVTGRRLHFLKIAAALEVAGEDQAAVVRQFVPRILDSFHMYLRAITPEELQGAEASIASRRSSWCAPTRRCARRRCATSWCARCSCNSGQAVALVGQS